MLAGPEMTLRALRTFGRLVAWCAAAATVPLGPGLTAFLDQLGFDVEGLADSDLRNSRGEVVGAIRVTTR